MALTTIDDRGLKTPIDLLDNEKIRFGTGNDLEILHNATNSEIKNNTGILFVRGDSLKLTSADGENYLIGTKDGSCELYHDNNLTFHTNATGTNTIGIHVDDGATHDGDVTFTGAAANAVWDKSDNALEFADNAKATFGASADLKIHHAGGTTNKIESGANTLYVAADDLQITNAAISEACLKTFADGAVELYYDNVKKLETTADGVTVSGDLNLQQPSSTTNYIQWDNSEGKLKLKDDIKITVGDGEDLQIYHNGSHSHIADGGTGNLYIASNQLLLYNAAYDEPLAKFIENGAVQLYYDNSEKVRTESYGLNIVGSNHLQLGDDGEIRVGNGSDLKIYHDGTNSNNKIQFDQQLLFRPHGSGGSYENSAAFNPNGSVDLYYDDVKKFNTTSGGCYVHGNLYPTSNGSGSIGTSSEKWNSAHFSANINVGGTSNSMGTTTFVGAGGAGGSIMWGQYDSSNKFRVHNNGTIYAVSTTISSISSERRTKENIVDIEDDKAWSTLKDIKLYSYSFKNDSSSTTHYGPIADEVPSEMVVPTSESDDVGVINTYNSEMLLFRAYSALQQAMKKIEVLETEVAALKAK